MRGKFHYQLNGWKYSAGIRVLLFLLLALIFYMSLYVKLVPQVYDIVLGTTSEKTIYAPRQIENAVATEQAKEDAAKRVQPVYRIVNLKNDTLIDVIYDKLLQINADEEVKFDDKVSIYRRVIPQLISDTQNQSIKSLRISGQYNDLLLEQIGQGLAEQNYPLPEETYFKLPRLTKDDLAAMRPVTKDIVNKLMNDQILDAQTARAKVAELVNTSNLTKNTSREMLTEIARALITPNKFFDQKGTEDAKGQARESVKPVYINKNDVLVKVGDVITEEIYARLDKLELLKDKANYLPQLGLCILSALLSFAIYMFVRQSTLPIKYNNSQLVMLILIFLINVIGMKLISLVQNLDYPYIGYLAPTALGSILIAILLDAPLAFIASVLFSLMASIIFNTEHVLLFDYRFGLVSLAICFTAVFTIQRASQRATILKAGLMIAFFSMLTITSMLLMEDHFQKKEALLSLSFAAAGGLLTVVFVIGLLPFFEVAFGILSPLKLVELSNPNHPLLRKLLTETPGTYHHSVMVGNLSEAAAESIGADGLLCRVGSYYHDIGKTKRPSYFIENQTNIENPHDRIDPNLSKSIIIAHPRDGVEMLKDYKMPKPLRDIAEQHHGTTLLHYFYHKAIKQAEDEGSEKEIREEDFRYPGPKAQSKEAAIVGIADSVEAAVRSLRNPTLEQIDSMVHKIIKSRLDDGQFNECDLTLKELDKIAKTLNETLLGIFHSRIEYPSELAPKKSGA
ncbi:HDIG domain-containing protein [Paenibacillus alginolyticus]|uniref:HDIG domain-containing protein n=2 Tax=Paenibacillus alginolyticus TaxID=59839 RepID=A0ABT4GKD5_9BACL|nr:HDIG domain-containing metalloprotein [Paenibacillus alginolyticus]MCY9669116.1 HDIG domain-containing protein [Paenibacillus alginolyticus]MCY9696576.1 HDIG domain-containing protein [Paenibacillus alginolyticus]MEC0145741.1 HDIG domain-containing protein [Paenibacillus alginolyticus]